MNIVEGLTAANLALGLVKDLREIDRSVDEATYRLKIAEITDALADAKIALSDAKLRISETRVGEVCPVCRDGTLMVLYTSQINNLLEKHECKCSNDSCDYECVRQLDTGSLKYRQFS